MLEYWILITGDSQGGIVSLYSPDLNRELLEDSEHKEDIEINVDFRAYTREILTTHFEKRNRILLPKNFEKLKDIPLTTLQHWEAFKINPNKKCGFFQKTLPFIGYVFNIVAILTIPLITFMALKIAANNDNEDNSTQSTALAILGSIFNSLITFFLYVLSDAKDALVETGYYLDNLFRRSDAPLIGPSKASSSKKQLCKIITLSLAAVGCIITNTLILAVRQYLEFGLLSDKYLKLNPNLSDSDYEKYYKLIKWLDILPNIFATSYCAIAFQGGFARKLIMKFTENSPNIKKVDTNNSENSKLIIRFKNTTSELLDELSLARNSSCSLTEEEQGSLKRERIPLHQYGQLINTQSTRYHVLPLEPSAQEEEKRALRYE